MTTSFTFLFCSPAIQQLATKLPMIKYCVVVEQKEMEMLPPAPRVGFVPPPWAVREQKALDEMSLETVEIRVVKGGVLLDIIPLVDDGELLVQRKGDGAGCCCAVFGKDPSRCHVAVDHPSASKVHCVALLGKPPPAASVRCWFNGSEPKDEGAAETCCVFLRDLSSSNGTFICGFVDHDSGKPQRLDPAWFYALRAGDSFQVGASARRYTVNVTEKEMYATPQSAEEAVSLTFQQKDSNKRRRKGSDSDEGEDDDSDHAADDDTDRDLFDEGFSAASSTDYAVWPFVRLQRHQAMLMEELVAPNAPSHRVAALRRELMAVGKALQRHINAVTTGGAATNTTIEISVVEAVD